MRLHIDGDRPGARRLQIFGELTYLWVRSSQRGNLPLSSFRRAVQPPLDLDQVLVFHDGEGRPVAAVSWAFLSRDAEEKLLAFEMLGPADWLSGPELWVMDVVSIDRGRAGLIAMRRFLAKLPMRVERFKAMRLSQRTGGLRLNEYRRNGRSWRIGSQDLIKPPSAPPS